MARRKDSPESNVYARMTINERLAILKCVFLNEDERILDYRARQYSLTGHGFNSVEIKKIKNCIREFGLV